MFGVNITPPRSKQEGILAFISFVINVNIETCKCQKMICGYFMADTNSFNNLQYTLIEHLFSTPPMIRLKEILVKKHSISNKFF